MSLDLARLLALDNAHATELSWLEPARLAELVDRACFVRAVGDAEAVAPAFDRNADYDSPSFLWVKARRALRLCRPGGRGRRRAQARPCAPGVVEIGAAAIHGGTKTVRSLERRLAG